LRGEPGDDLDDLDAWLAEAKADEAASARVRERWLTQQAGEQARFALVLFDAATRGLTVRVRTAAAAHAGRVATVGHDFVELRTTRGATVLVATGAIAVVEAAAGTALGGGRERDEDKEEDVVTARLADRLAEAAPDRPSVELRVTGGERVVGELRAAGVDVVTVRTATSPPAECYVPLASVSEVIFLGSG
jgi:hypothetical protein